MVKKTIFFVGLAAAMLNQGCHACKCNSSKCGPLDYHTPLKEWWMEYRNCQRAKETWREVQSQSYQAQFSSHYRIGFEHGYADYLTRGGSGGLPAVPPRAYWKLRYEAAEGKQAIEDWYLGYHHGVTVAQASGLREESYIPTTTSVYRRPGHQRTPQYLPTGGVELLPTTPEGTLLHMPLDTVPNH